MFYLVPTVRVNFLIIGTSQQISKVHIDGVRIGLYDVKPSATARNLGVYFDTNLNMETQVINVCKSTYYLLYNLRRIRKYFDQESMKLVVQALITSKLDYCNGLLFGMPDTLISKLQRVQNACAKLVYCQSKFTSTAPLLRELHWLPVRQRISFKILLIVYKSLCGQAPSYITELLQLKVQPHSHSLRSSNDILLLQIPHSKTKITLGDRAFAIAAPKLWNSLPFEIRSSPSVNVFKSKLKSYLFN